MQEDPGVNSRVGPVFMGRVLSNQRLAIGSFFVSEVFPSSQRGKFVDQSSYKEERLFAAILDLILPGRRASNRQSDASFISLLVASLSLPNTTRES